MAAPGPESSQLPIEWYFDRQQFEREMSVLFKNGPGYVGHELMVPNAGDYIVLPWTDNGRVLVRSDGGVNLLSNVCRHRQSLLLEGRGKVRNIVCPLHRWTYDLEGKLMGAPEFEQTPQLALTKTPLQSWRGLLFAGKRDVARELADFELADDYDFTGYVFDRMVIDECRFNWKTFLEIYLELYHVVYFHPGLQQFVDAGSYQWGFGKRWSHQILGIKDGWREQVSPNYTRYRDAILAFSGGEYPKYGVLWSIYYPSVMLEWYPYSLVVSTLVPRSPGHTTNVVEFYYPEEVALFERGLVEAHQAAYMESAAEDAQICTHLHEGRRTLYEAGENDMGPYHRPHEDGMIHFHRFLRKELGETAEALG
ncbi:MAG TPA: aromatic ring-hydroxylating dioxygenase subunit alpha [Burkholderiales bacterium]|nr:aromatic ring-hydroxylating dioxygenase subunit alpha [Burkholderiales bacterium]